MCISRQSQKKPTSHTTSQSQSTKKPRNGQAKAKPNTPATNFCNMCKFTRFGLLFVPLFCFAPYVVESTTAWEYLDDLENFVPELERSLMEIQRHLYSGDEYVLEEMARRCTALSQLVSSYRTQCMVIVQDSNCDRVQLIFMQLESIIDEVIAIIHSYRTRLAEQISFFHLREAGCGTLHAVIVNSELQGRPSYAISEEQVISLRSIGFRWNQIADMIGISERTLRRRRAEFVTVDGSDNFTNLSDADLDNIMRDIVHECPNAGERMVIGSLRARGVIVQRTRVRESILRVDPMGRALRAQRRAIKRRVYNVPCPNALWYVHFIQSLKTSNNSTQLMCKTFVCNNPLQIHHDGSNMIKYA